MSVIRIKKTENYVTLHKGCLENENISFKAKGLWAYCISRPNDWEFHVSHLATVSKDGEDAIYSAIKELESQGYCRKIQKNVGGKFGSVDYEMFEVPFELKKCLPHRDFPDAGFPDAGNPVLLKNDNKLKNDKRINNVSPQAAILAAFLLDSVKKTVPDLKTPDMSKWDSEIDKMIRIDGRTPEKISEMIKWLPSNQFWAKNILSAKKLREKFDQLTAHMNFQPVKEFSHEQWANVTCARLNHPDIETTKDSIRFINRANGHDLLISFKENGFKEQVFSRLRKMNIDTSGL